MAKTKTSLFGRLVRKSEDPLDSEIDALAGLLAQESTWDLTGGYPFATNGGEGAITSSMKTDKWLKQFNENPRLSALAKIVADNGTAEYGIYTNTDTGKKRVINHPLEKLIRSHTVPMFFSLWTAYRYMTGTVYIAYTVRSKEITDLKVFTTQQLASSDDGNYVFNYGSKKLTYSKKNVIVDFDLDLSNPYHSGFGKAAAIMEEIESDTLIQRYLKSFYFNSARPDAFIIPKINPNQTAMDEPSLRRLTTQFRDNHQGIQNAHKIAVLGFDASIETISTNHREMELLSTRKLLRDLSYQHFGMPPEIMGSLENSNKATVVAAEHIYAKQVRLPLLRHFEDILNTDILPKFNHSEGMFLEFDSILPDDEEMSIKKASEGREACSLQINEHRRLLGFPPLVGDSGKYLIGAVAAEGQELSTVEVESPHLTYGDSIDYQKQLMDKEVAILTGGAVTDGTQELEIYQEEIHG